MGLCFAPFDPHKPVRKYWRDLPHWRRAGATYFVTFRLWDSLPQHAVAHLAALRRTLAKHAESDALWLQADRETFRMLKRFLDAGHGACFMRDAAAREAVAEALAHSDSAHYELGEFAILPNHVHALVRPLGARELESVLHGWKSYTAHRINRLFGRKGRVWQEEAYDRIVRDRVELARTERYIRRNRGESA